MSAIEKICPEARNFLLVPENQTRNQFYLQNVAQLRPPVLHDPDAQPVAEGPLLAGSSWSTITRSAPRRSTSVASSSTLPWPKKDAGSGCSRRCMIEATTLAPAERARWASSSRESRASATRGRGFEDEAGQDGAFHGYRHRGAKVERVSDSRRSTRSKSSGVVASAQVVPGVMRNQVSWRLAKFLVACRILEPASSRPSARPGARRAPGSRSPASSGGRGSSRGQGVPAPRPATPPASSGRSARRGDGRGPGGRRPGQRCPPAWSRGVRGRPGPTVRHR